MFLYVPSVVVIEILLNNLPNGMQEYKQWLGGLKIWVYPVSQPRQGKNSWHQSDMVTIRKDKIYYVTYITGTAIIDD